MNIVQAGMNLVVYVASVMIIYFLISTPVETIFNAFVGIESHYDAYVGTLKTVFIMCISLAAAIGPLWFFMWVMHREPQWQY